MSIIRAMEKKDIEAVYRIEVQSFRTPWSKQSLTGELHNRVAHYLVMEQDDAIIGYCGMWVLFDEAHITNIAVAPEYRRCGLGRRMMLCAMRTARLYGAAQMTLEVRETNFAAQALYASLDFEMAGARKGYYFDTGESAFILWNRDIAHTLEARRPSAESQSITTKEI